MTGMDEKAIEIATRYGGFDAGTTGHRWLAEAIAEALSALDVPAHPEGVKDGWLDIDSAPRDGTKVDLWVVWPAYGEKVKRQERCADAKFLDDAHGWLLGSFSQAAYSAHPRPTHWRPVPTGPNEAPLAAPLSHPEPVAQEAVDERAAFEAWAATEWSNGQGVPHHAWTGWQGRAALRVRVAELEASATPQAGASEAGAVAQWQVWVDGPDDFGQSGWVNEDAGMVDHWRSKGRKVRPLYATPPDSDAVRALRRLLSLCESGGDPFEEPNRDVVNQARAALSNRAAAMASDLIERLTALATRLPTASAYVGHKGEFYTNNGAHLAREIRDAITEAATALAVERERAEKAERERHELLLALDRYPAGARELRAALSYDRHRADKAEASLAEAKRLLKPFADLASAIDELAAAGQRKLQPEESADLSDGEIAELVTPGSNIIATDGRMAFGHAAPIGKPVAITVNDARAAARFLAQEEARPAEEPQR